MNIKAWMKKPIVSAILVNLIVLFGLLLVFEPTPKVDDYLPLAMLYGGFSGEYSPYLFYCNILLGKFIVLLQTIIPEMAWYYIVQYIWIFVCLTGITLLLQNRFCALREKVLGGIILSYMAYEYYVRITFSKTAGLLCITGFFLIWHIVNQTDSNWKEKIGCFFVGILLVFLGCLIRDGMLTIVYISYAVALVIFLLENIGNKKWRCLVTGTITCVTFVVCVFFMNKTLITVNQKAYEHGSQWSGFFEYNYARAQLFDYEWPQYEDYQDAYKNLGISENDYYMWKDLYYIGDTDRFTVELMNQISNLLPKGNVNWIKQIGTCLKLFFTHYLSQIEFYIVLLLFFFAGGVKNRRAVLFFLLYLANFILFYVIVGRVRHHVELTFAIVCGLLMAFYKNERSIERRQVYVSVACACLALSTFFYNKISNSSYNQEIDYFRWSEEQEYHDNYKKLQLFSEDEAHLYILGMKEESGLMPGHSIFEVVEKGFYHNIYPIHLSNWRDCVSILQNYGVPGTNVFDGITENEAIYYVESPRCKGNYTIVTQYIKEHYDENVRCTKVKTVDDVNIFKFDSGELDVDYDVLSNSSLVTQQVEVKEKSDSKLTISGYVFVNGKDSFAQNIYLETTDNITGEQEYYYTLQKENTGLGNVDKYQGLYSKFSVNIKKSKLQGKEVRLILQVDGETYALPVDVSQWIVE